MKLYLPIWVGLSFGSLSAATVVIGPPPGPLACSGTGSCVSGAVGYSTAGIGQSVVIPSEADELILGSFALLQNGAPSSGTGSGAAVYLFRSEYRGLTADILGGGVGSVGGPLAVAYWDGNSGYDFRAAEIELQGGEKLWFYTNELTTMALVEGSYPEGDTYLPGIDSEEDEFGDAINIPDLDYTIVFRVIAVPEPGVSIWGLSGLLLLGVRRRSA